MPDPTMQVQSRRVFRVTVTFPAFASTAVTIESLVVDALNARTPFLGESIRQSIVGGFVNPTTADYIAGDAIGSLDLTIPTASSTGYSEPSTGFLKQTYVKAAAAGAITGVVISVFVDGLE